MSVSLKRGLAVLVATAATVTTMSVVSPAFASSRVLYAIYPTSADCRAAGNALIRAKYARDFECLWDSPGFALWVQTVK
ncbi:hypothetical protein OG589_05510 [Sphaerisporangium sp. NBC_01403]|uniref:hypothetical protein n=1 Tax=Sphaerisporangium sp. NBC_01403 TaxID=2903599 RepID=UPI0032542EA9